MAYAGELIGLSICEDLWVDGDLTGGRYRYRIDPIQDLADEGATLLLNASASPGHLGSFLPQGRSAPWAVPSKAAQRRRLLQGLAARHGLPLVYASRIGAEAGCCSTVVLAWPSPVVAGRVPNPHEGIVWVDTAEGGQGWPEEPAEGGYLRAALTMGLKDNLAKQGLEAVVIGLSGGIDSAVVAAMAAAALGSG